MRISDWSSDVCSSDLSQLPVLDSDGKVVGIIDEGDILLKVFHDDSRFKDPISSAMTSRLETIEADQPMEALLPIFAKDHVRSDARRVGTECVSQCRSRWSPYP